MTDIKLRPGSPIYVPEGEKPIAFSIGAVMQEGDARLYIPSPLPEGVSLDAFQRWSTEQARLMWVGEYLSSVFGMEMDLMRLAGILEQGVSEEDVSDDQAVPLYVPREHADLARLIPGVRWDRRRKAYVAGKVADFGLIHQYLTPAMRAIWIAERNVDAAMKSLVRARAMIGDVDDDQRGPREV